MSVQLVLDELAAARKSQDKATAFVLQSSPLTSRVIADADPPVNKASPLQFPITVVTENGFSIMRLCDREQSTHDSTGGCHFIVCAPNCDERCIMVVFSAAVIAVLQKQRWYRAPLPTDHRFWLHCSEGHLATYLWENDCYPPDELLIVDTLTSEDLLLARHSE